MDRNWSMVRLFCIKLFGPVLGPKFITKLFGPVRNRWFVRTIWFILADHLVRSVIFRDFMTRTVPLNFRPKSHTEIINHGPDRNFVPQTGPNNIEPNLVPPCQFEPVQLFGPVRLSMVMALELWKKNTVYGCGFRQSGCGNLREARIEPKRSPNAEIIQIQWYFKHLNTF